MRARRSALVIVAGATLACGPAATATGDGAPRVAAKIVAGAIGAKPCAGVEAFGYEWVTNYGAGTLVRIDPRRNRLVGKPIRLGPTPCGIAAGAGSLWIDGYGSNTVERVSPTRLRVVKRIRVGSAPFDVAFGFGSVWATSNGDGTVSRISPRTNRVVRTIRTGGGPAGLSIAAGSVWIGSNGDENVYRIDPATHRVTHSHRPAAPCVARGDRRRHLGLQRRQRHGLAHRPGDEPRRSDREGGRTARRRRDRA
jgi:YVTN family beta-propeller protein